MIRPFGLRDTLMLRQLQPQRVGFDLRRLLLYSPSPMRSALAAYFTGHHLGVLTCVHCDTNGGNSPDGFAQIWPRVARSEWDLAFLAPSLDRHQRAAEVWYRLLSHLTVLGAEQGIMRIYARSSEDAEAEEVLRQAGYTVIAREEILQLTQPVAAAPVPNGMRRMTHEDRWALSEFCRQVVPYLAQQAEGYAPPWGAARNRTLAWPLPVHEYVWADKGTILAYLGLCSGARGHWLDVVVRPEYRADAMPYINYILTLAQCSAERPVYCPVPDYAVGLGWPLRTCAFEPYTRQVLRVVHTVARVLVRRPILVAGLEGGRMVRPVQNTVEMGVNDAAVKARPCAVGSLGPFANHSTLLDDRGGEL